MTKLRIGTRRPWSEARPLVETRLAVRFPDLDLTVDDEPSIAWLDGPGETTLAGALGELPGWRLCLALDHPDPEADAAAGDRRRPVWIRRSFSDEALAVAVVRYQASHVRPYDSTRPGAEVALRDVLDVDDPAVSGYPLSDAMAALLLAAPDAGEASGEGDRIVGTTRADHWSRRLVAVGYSELWNQAYAQATIWLPAPPPGCRAGAFAEGSIVMILGAEPVGFGTLAWETLKAIVFFLPLAFSAWAFLDVAHRPSWAWALAGRSRVNWLIVIALGVLTLIGGIAISAWYLIRVRPLIAAAEDGDIPT